MDLLNPGQVFACIGFAEAANVLCGHAAACFDWSDPIDARFRLRANGELSPFTRVLRFLVGATAHAIAIEGSPNHDRWVASWGPAPVASPPHDGYPFPDPASPEPLTCVIRNAGEQLILDHWGDESGRDKVKFWTGPSGQPGAALAQKMLAQLRGFDIGDGDPFAFSAPQSSSFRLDWRRDYVPIDAGFSLNVHSKMDPMGFPIVELLGALGLGAARPNRRSTLHYDYAIVGRESTTETLWLPLSLLRASLGDHNLPFPTRHFRIRLSRPSKHARAITTVTEDVRK
ncbi:MAG: type I-U CRISPR-associated protein Cas8c [Planctomycetota bacterium]